MKADAKIHRMAQLTPQDDYIKTALRLPREVHAQIQQAAAASGRSMNAEIVSRLEASFSRIALGLDEDRLAEEVASKVAEAIFRSRNVLLEKLGTEPDKPASKAPPQRPATKGRKQ